jgi:hypothetical protein
MDQGGLLSIRLLSSPPYESGTMDNRFTSLALNNDQVQEARNCLQLSNIRRKMYRLGSSPVRLLVDGDQHLRFQPHDSLRTAFTIPTNSGFLELHGDDAQGDILIAVFLIPDYPTTFASFIDRVAFPYLSGGMMQIEISWLGKAKSARRSCHLCTSMVSDCLG